MFRLSLLTAVVLALSGCASAPPKISYYQFDAYEQRAAASIESEGPVIVVNGLELPDYLTQSAIVLQTNTHQLHFSTLNVWAESPTEAFHAALMTDLNQLDGNYRFRSWKAPRDKQTEKTLNVEITHFYPTYNSEVVLVGQIDVFDLASETSVTKGFSFRKDIPADGYQASVRTMRSQIKELAEEVQKLLAN